MIYPIETLGETRFDLRMIAILITTLYGGWLPGLIVLVSVSLARFLIGGHFLYIGILVNVSTFFIGMVFRSVFLKSTFKYLTATIVVFCYFLIYITILYYSVHFLKITFYLTYFIAFYSTYISLIFVINRLIKNNKQIEEMVYLDKLTTVGQLTASIAHEIRNPISTVRGFIQYLSKDTKDENFKNYSPLILEELDRTNNIITNYLTMAKPERYQLSKIPIHQVIDECVQLMRPFASYANVAIEIRHIEPGYVRGDEQRLRQALINVIKNAIESVDLQGTVSIETHTNKQKEQVEIQIVDSGRGMTSEQLKQIGLPYFTTKTKGTGLGSMITHKIIHEMNGKIEYESELHVGTTVNLTFPLSGIKC